MAVEHVTYSGFLRGPSDVLPKVERADVVLERRDGEDLVLSTMRRATAFREGLNIGITALRHLAHTHQDLLGELLGKALPWMVWLPDAERRACAEELIGDLAASVEVDNFARFHQDLVAWQHTAEVWADPNVAARLQEDFAGVDDEVLRPTHGG